MTHQTAPVPAHQSVYQALRGEILSGGLVPGEAVTIQGLAARLEAGMTPVREALRRLTAEGALSFMGNRRICVPILTASDVDELRFARATFEPELTRRAAVKATSTEVAALAETDAALDDAIQTRDMRGYLVLNHRFHCAVYALAEAPVLAGLAESLWLRFGPSLRGVLEGAAMPGAPDMHKPLIDALHAGDADAAADAMRRDVDQGMDRLSAGLTAPQR